MQEAWGNLIVSDAEGRVFKLKITIKRQKKFSFPDTEEKEVYMPDYVLDDHGILQELRYDRVSVW